MKFRKIKEIQKVKAFDPKTEVYSVDEPTKGILFNEVFIPLEKVPLDIIAIGQKIFTVDGAGYLKIWEEGILIETIENADLLSKSDNNQILKYYYDKEWNSYDNILDLETNKLILKESIPYQLYVEKNIIIAYDIFEGEIKRINTDIETLWQFTIASLGDSPYPDEEDRIDKIVGIANGNLWVYTKLYRLVALDIETGNVQYHTDCFGVQLDEVTENIFAIASNGWTVIDTQTFTIKEDYFFSKEDPEGMGQYESVYKPLLQGDYFTFIGSKHKEYGGIGWIGIFDYKARKLVWEYELLPFEERKTTRNRLVAPQPLYMSGNKLYIKDIKDNLYIFEREE
ncbi:hypothetical protein [Capnocytophaga sp. CM59]|uniref:hypothetical protein n=1 Tax=Capnocytophaga sp. CM59 TaxID=936370 RepID=UPI00027C6595|nr:hypothetical protein [Capnocytophaga sp. CM59]EJU29264.1 hypothetical protein HMPREF1154_2253 [Capnocytophaga sp. CM59]